jgi:hypothetical protein
MAIRWEVQIHFIGRDREAAATTINLHKSRVRETFWVGRSLLAWNVKHDAAELVFPSNWDSDRSSVFGCSEKLTIKWRVPSEKGAPFSVTHGD